MIATIVGASSAGTYQYTVFSTINWAINCRVRAQVWSLLRACSRHDWIVDDNASTVATVKSRRALGRTLRHQGTMRRRRGAVNTSSAFCGPFHRSSRLSVHSSQRVQAREPLARRHVFVIDVIESVHAGASLGRQDAGARREPRQRFVFVGHMATTCRHFDRRARHKHSIRTTDSALRLLTVPGSRVVVIAGPPKGGPHVRMSGQPDFEETTHGDQSIVRGGMVALCGRRDGDLRAGCADGHDSRNGRVTSRTWPFPA